MDKHYAMERWLDGKATTPQLLEAIQVYILQKERAKMEVMIR